MKAQKIHRTSYAQLSKVVQAKISLNHVEHLAMICHWDQPEIGTGIAMIRKELEKIEQQEGKNG